MSCLKNPFRQPMMHKAFDELVSAYERRSKLLFHEDKPIRSNSAGVMFWRGFDGVQIGVWDRASKETFAYAHWRAGKECRKLLDKQP